MLWLGDLVAEVPMSPWMVITNTLMWGTFLFNLVPMNYTLTKMAHSDLTESYTHKQNFLIWNVQGAGSRAFLNILREHIRLHKPSIVGLVETRISGRKAKAVCDKIDFTNCFSVEVQGSRRYMGPVEFT